MAEVLMAAESAAIALDGIPHVIEAGRTLAHADHPIVTNCPALWQPLRVHYSTVEPDARAVRAWAAEQGIEVSAKGKLPAEVVGQYQAAQGA